MNTHPRHPSNKKIIAVRDGDTIEEPKHHLPPVQPITDPEAEFLDDEQNLDQTEEVAKFIQKSHLQSSEDVPEKHDKRTRHRKLHQIQKARFLRILKICIIAIFTIAFICLGIFFFAKSHTEENVTNLEHPAPLQSDKIYYSALTGQEVADRASTKAATTCVMIENSPDARPQSGLDQAGVVFEAIAEGGITRFMAIYQEAKPQFIGPVRSLRLTYAEMAKPFHCSIAHVGGADNALQLVRGNTAFRDIDQFYNGSSYWRESGNIAGRRRYAPHNVYTSFEKLDSLNYRRGYNESIFSGFARINPDSPSVQTEQNATHIKITLSSDLYNPTFTYQADSNSYLRAHTNGGAHNAVDANGKITQLNPKVVIAMKVNAVKRPGPDGYTDYTTTGTGEAFVFQNGGVVIGTWKRDNLDAELKFFDGENHEIKLNRGQTWISLYPSNRGSVNYWK